MFGRCMDFLMKSSWAQIKEKLNICKNDFVVYEMVSVGKYIIGLESKWRLGPGPLRIVSFPMFWDVIYNSDPLEEVMFKSKYSSKYVTAPSFDKDSAFNDLKRVCEGLEDIDEADHIIFCKNLSWRY